MQVPVDIFHDAGETFLIISSSFLKFAVFASSYPHDAEPPGSAEIIVLTRMFFTYEKDTDSVCRSDRIAVSDSAGCAGSVFAG